ncbi:MAG: AMP-binding protein [Pseudomonadota bacterium]
MTSVALHFETHVREVPDARCLSPASRQSLSRSDVFEKAQQIARRLAGAGAHPGERVTVIAEKSPEAFLTYLACNLAGYVYHPANIGYTDAEVSFLVSDAAPAVIVCDPARRAAFSEMTDGAVLTLDRDGAGSLMSVPEVDLAPYTAQSDDWAALLYTSGTTGKPKGAMLSQGNLLSNALTLVETWQFVPEDRLLHMLPIFHAHGLFVAGNTAFCAGAEILFESAFSPDRFFARLSEATSFMAVPTIYGRLLADDRLKREIAGHMRLFTSGSAPLDAVAHQAFEARTGQRILERYGMTETLMLTSNPYDGERRPGTVGPPLPGISLGIRKSDGDLAQPGEIGIVEVRGPNVCSGYFNLPDKTAEAFTEDGFLITGDIGVQDGAGYVTLQGRQSDMIISGGYNVYPREVENVLLDLEGVVEAAVFGVPHPDFGEGVVAVIVAAHDGPDEADLTEQARTQIAAYKCPKRILRVDALPKNAMGKVDREQLKAGHAGLFSGA